MSNMSYCMFHNTLLDLQQCEEYVEEFNLSVSENKARIKLIKLCKDITERFFDLEEENEEEFEKLKLHFKGNNED